jgi:hypothetical protein
MKALWLSLLTLVLSCALLAGCERCSRSALAKLDGKNGKVDRDFASHVGTWGNASVGDRFDEGDGVRTGEKSGALLGLEDGSRLSVEEASVVRFLARKPGGAHAMNVEMGEALFEVGATGTELVTSTGIARLDAGTQVRLARTGDSMRYLVTVGSAEFDDGKGHVAKLSQGEGIVVGIGSAVFDRFEEKSNAGAAPATSVAATRPEAAPEDASNDQGNVHAEVTGNGAQVQDSAGGAFEKLPPGSHDLSAGSTLKLAAGTTVDLKRGKDGATVRGNGTYVVGAEGAFVKFQNGAMTVKSEGTVRVAVPGGVIVAHAGGAAEIHTEKNEGTVVRVERAKVQIESANAKEQLAVGEVASLSADGEIAVQGRGLSYADVEATAGDSIVIHDPSPPTAVRFLFGDKCKEGVIRIEGHRSEFARGDGSVAVALKPGVAPYRLFCATEAGLSDKPAASGKMIVMQDAGLRPMPKEAPVTSVELDGRNYTVLYQNQLPRVMLRWSKAPSEDGAYTVTASGPTGARTFPASKSTYTLPAGVLGEGQHLVHMEGGGRVSRQSTVIIRFDNAAPTATLETPVNSGASAGSPLSVVGTVLPGWSVRVNGAAVPLDGARFSLQAMMPTNERALAIWLLHPERGTHVYLRRAAGAQ